MSAHTSPQGPVQGRWHFVPDAMLCQMTTGPQPVNPDGYAPSYLPFLREFTTERRALFQSNTGEVTITLALDYEDPAVLGIFLDHIYTRDLHLQLFLKIRPYRVQGLAALAVMAATHRQQQLYSQIQALLMQINRTFEAALAPQHHMLLLARDTLLATVTLHQHIAGYKELCLLQDAVFLILKNTRQLSIMSPPFVAALKEHILEHCDLTKMLIKYLAGGTISGTEH
ncbi:hypothetical protein LTR24_002693 [Lithohypha guttulata]|uniref:Uncharacterized protein n=1 Tax=Lithohypha guttulata TaxID=1690604 RepID=A0ABR0KHB1_9EURO|nr:hypothetical protein LTR24_002693 [Lithohypha guttulata]